MVLFGGRRGGRAHGEHDFEALFGRSEGEAGRGRVGSYDRIVQLKLRSPDGKYYSTDCANTEGMFCIIQPNPPRGKSSRSRDGSHGLGYERIRGVEYTELFMTRGRMVSVA